MVTGVVTAAVHVAVTCGVGEDDRWTDGSLAVQLEFSGAGVTAGQPGLLLNWKKALKVWLLPGAAAVWSAVAVGGTTLMPFTPQSDALPPQPVVNRRPAPRKTPTTNLDVTICLTPLFLPGGHFT
jgi:hypothetical protein